MSARMNDQKVKEAKRCWAQEQRKKARCKDQESDRRRRIRNVESSLTDESLLTPKKKVEGGE